MTRPEEMCPVCTHPESEHFVFQGSGDHFYCLCRVGICTCEQALTANGPGPRELPDFEHSTRRCYAGYLSGDGHELLDEVVGVADPPTEVNPDQLRLWSGTSESNAASPAPTAGA